MVGKISNKKIEIDKKPITSSIFLDAKVNDNFSLLKDEALLGNKSKTNKLLSDTIIDSEKNIYYLSSINQRLNKLNEIISKSKLMFENMILNK